MEEQQVQTDSSMSNDKKEPVLFQVDSFKELKLSEYYMIKFSNNKFLSKNDMPLLYHKSAVYQDEATKVYSKVYETIAEQAKGTYIRADKGMGKLFASIPTVSSVLVLGKVIKRKF